ncbi:TPA: hypothetical protein DDW35_01540 [Candidatus Sumerlaeota bacterium]|jgi:serine phosphatase RsbU (regulator of sigma subunit)/AmiR/NasT family two-component response regulator|nr:hypothetical protein [Candidatus Sumerlaeota bacterium]
MDEKLRVLVVDDDDGVLFALHHFLGRRGDEVTLAHDAVEALAFLHEHDFDVLLSDITMPGMDGLELAGEARKIRPEMTCLIMSGAGSRADLLKAMQAGVFDFLDKPFPDLPTLGLMIDRAGQQSRLVRERNELADNLKQQNDKLYVSLCHTQEAYGRLRQQEEMLRSDLRQAQRVQEKLLPAGFSHLNGLSLFGYYGPCERLGGDFFGEIPLGPNRVAAYLTDVAGHGVSAAMITVILRELIHARWMSHADNSMFETPASALAFLNRGLLEAGFNPPILATMVYTVIDAEKGTMVTACAGHPAPIHVTRDGKTTPLATSGPVLGLDTDGYYKQVETTLAPGDFLLLYSDGLPESRDAAGVEWSDEGLQGTLKQLAGRSLHDVADGLQSAMDVALRGHPAADDRTFLIALKTETKFTVTPNMGEEFVPHSVKVQLPERVQILPPTQGGRLACGWVEEICVVSLSGLGTWQQAPALRDLIESATQRTQERIHLDLSECKSLDSTMLGLSYQMAHHLVLHEPSKRVLGQFSDMGILNVFDILREPPPAFASEPVIYKEPSHELCSDLILSAHESLMGVSKENLERFGSMVELIRKRDQAGNK